MPSARVLALGALLLSSFIWGANTPIMKWSLGAIPLFSLAFLRFYLATIFLFPFVIKSLKIRKKDLLKIILAALFGITFNVSFFFLGLKLTFAVNAALIIATIPIFTVAAAQIFLKEKIGGRLILATLIAILGLLAIIGPPILNFGLTHLFGGIFLILASLFWVGYEILSKDLFKKYSAQTITFYSFLIGSLSFLPFFLWELSSSPWLLNLKFQGITGIIYGAIFSSTIAYLAWEYGLSKIKASEASFFFYLDPISGVLLSILLLGEKITPSCIFGGLLIILAVILAEAKRKEFPLHKKLTKS
jgi:drug/metabolite transporter (DMT)-like permease